VKVDFERGLHFSLCQVLGDPVSVGHQAAKRARRQQFARYAAKDPLPEAAVSVSASDNEIRPFMAPGGSTALPPIHLGEG
jgi:hypothetical protein